MFNTSNPIASAVGYQKLDAGPSPHSWFLCNPLVGEIPILCGQNPPACEVPSSVDDFRLWKAAKMFAPNFWL